MHRHRSMRSHKSRSRHNTPRKRKGSQRSFFSQQTEDSRGHSDSDDEMYRRKRSGGWAAAKQAAQAEGSLYAGAGAGALPGAAPGEDLSLANELSQYLFGGANGSAGAGIMHGDQGAQGYR